MTENAAFTPDWVSPPGETIEDLLEERGWTKAELADRTAFTPKHVNELLKGRAPITADAAERLARVLGSTAEFWLEREAQYQAALVRKRTVEELAGEAGWLRELPSAWMKKTGLVKRFREPGAQVAECLRFFAVASVAAWRVRYEQPIAAYRASPAFAKRVGALAAWLREGERQAAHLDCSPWDKTGFSASLEELRRLTDASSLEACLPRIQELCAAHGVAAVVLPAPPGAAVHGATRWLSTDKALLLLSLRHKTNDQFWFSFFHEAAHLLLHGKKLIFIDEQDGLDDQRESEADRFARDKLLPPRDAKRLQALARKGRVSKEAVRRFADEAGVAPGIVVGRLQHEGWLPHSHLNDLKARYA